MKIFSNHKINFCKCAFFLQLRYINKQKDSIINMVLSFLFVARETLRLCEIAGRSDAVNSCIGCIGVA